MIPKKVVVIGSGFSSISAATHLANHNFEVTILEKNETPGGRARSFKESGFTFDMGPSWYWMPDVFENYFKTFGKHPSDYYDLKRIDPSYTVIFSEKNFMRVPANFEKLKILFDSLESGSSNRLVKFLAQAEYKYQVGMNDLVYKPGRSLSEYLSFKLLIDLFRLDVLQSFHSHVRKFFHHPELLQLIEFPILFLGALPKNTPALYSLMNYADLQLGTWYPMGGMFKIVEAMVELAKSKGVKFIFNQEVKEIRTSTNEATHVLTGDQEYEADIVVAGADYNHVEEDLLKKKYRTYSKNYWDSRTLAPSSLIFYLGINKKLNNITHHNLFFDQDFISHAKEIYQTPSWPSNPLFYVSAPSVTDPSVAPEGHENLFFLIPVAPGLQDTEEIREKYFDMILKRFEKLTRQTIRENIIYKKSYAHSDFIKDYHAFKGNAYGLANTLMQTAVLKPSLKSKKIKNLYFTGQLTVPGPGVPPSLISGKVVSSEIIKDFNPN